MRSARSKGKKDRDYLTFIHSLNCVACERGEIIVYVGRRAPIHAHHAGVRGLGQKAGDDTAIPLCVQHHQTGKDAVHVIGKRFWQHHGIDKADLIRRLNDLYNQLQQQGRTECQN